MTDPPRREPRPSRPYGGEPGARTRGRDPGLPRAPGPGARTPRRDPGQRDPGQEAAGPRGGRAGGQSGRQGNGQGSGQGSGGWGDPRGAGPRGRNPGAAGREPRTDAQTRRLPAQPETGKAPRTQSGGAQPGGAQPAGTQPVRPRSAGTPTPGSRRVQGQTGGQRSVAKPAEEPGRRAAGPGGRRAEAGRRRARTQPSDRREGEARGATGPRDSLGRAGARSRRSTRRSPGLGRWGALQGGLGVCIIVSSAAVGTIATMVSRSTPGPLLGFFVITGTVAAALAVRPSAGRTIVPVPALAYLVAALISGVVFNRSAATSKAALAIGAAQWVADGFFAMVLATVLALVITVARWYLWRRSRPAVRDRDWSVPAATPARSAREPVTPVGASAPVGAMAPAGTGPVATGQAVPPRRAPAPGPGGTPGPGAVSGPGGAQGPGIAPGPGTAPGPGLAPGPGTAPGPGIAPGPGTAPRPGGAPGRGGMPAPGSAPAGPGGAPGRGGAPGPGGGPGGGRNSGGRPADPRSRPRPGPRDSRPYLWTPLIVCRAGLPGSAEPYSFSIGAKPSSRCLTP